MDKFKKDIRTMKMTKNALICGGLAIGICGIIPPIFFQGSVDADSVLGGIIVIGLGALAECALKIYDRISDIDKLCNQNPSDKSS